MVIPSLSKASYYLHYFSYIKARTTSTLYAETKAGLRVIVKEELFPSDYALSKQGRPLLSKFAHVPEYILHLHLQEGSQGLSCGHVLQLKHVADMAHMPSRMNDLHPAFHCEQGDQTIEDEDRRC